ncbi:uncharacterized protein [Dermacentor albipictus]|uniref:uncharacterized protein isoform X3 n=1 Tax=Dermacentor albipictus TaxID=60249 RepID=UPI0031FD2419
MFALVTPSPPPPPPPIILVQQQREASPRLRRRNRDKAFPVEEFVDAVQQHRFLFDRNEPEFKNVAMKEAMWEAIGQQFGISGNKAMSKWRNMRDKYFKLRKQELLNRRLCTPRFRKPVKVWPFYHVMRQLFDSKNTATLEDSQPEAAGGQEDLVAELAFDPAWITNSNADAHDPELASIMTLHMDNGTAVSVKQEPPDETDASEHEASNLVVSGGKDGPAVDSDHEDLETLASLQRSITVARALFHKCSCCFVRLQDRPITILLRRNKLLRVWTCASFTKSLELRNGHLSPKALASEDDTASPTSDVEIHGVTIVLAPNKSTGGWPVAREAAERKMSAHAHTGPLLPRE